MLDNLRGDADDQVPLWHWSDEYQENREVIYKQPYNPPSEPPGELKILGDWTLLLENQWYLNL